MATVTSTFASYDRSIPSSSSSGNFRTSSNPTVSRQNHGFFTNQTSPPASRIGQSLDDMDILALKRQYANLDLFEQSTLSNSAEDLSQLDRSPYRYDVFDPDENDLDDDDIPYDDGSAYDYTIAIQERLKKANEELQHDQTSSELKHHRVSFDSVVKAVDIVQDPNDHEDIDPIIRPSVSPVAEEPSTNLPSPRSDSSTHQYTVPLNDTQAKEGATLLERIKAWQFQETIPTNERWATAANNDSPSNHEDHRPVKSNENNINNQELSNANSTKNSMVVSVNGRFDLKNEDDYMAKHPQKSPTNKKNSSSTKNKTVFLPTPPTEPKQKQDSLQRPVRVRPKSSEINRTKSSSEKKTKTDTNNRQRPKSAGVSKSIEVHTEKPSSSVDFDELLRKAVEKKRAELKEERRKRKAAEEQREKELAKAKESYERWLQEKESERKRINEEKRMEKEEHEIRQAEQEKELTELRERKFREWLERKEHEATLVEEFKKLIAKEEAMTFGESSSAINSERKKNHRAFQKWLREKYHKSMEEKRQARLEVKRQRRHQRRSIKRQQLQQDLQLAKSFGYS